MRDGDEKRKRVLENAMRRFRSSGFSGVTMDEIARGVGMGKGTLYALFPSKQALLSAALDDFETTISLRLDGIVADKGLSDFEKLGKFMQTVSGQLSAVNPAALADFERTAPEAYEKVEQMRQHIILTRLFTMLREGKAGGLYDPLMDERIVAHILIGAARQLSQAQVFSALGCTLESMFQKILSVILKGCLTAEGRRASETGMRNTPVDR